MRGVLVPLISIGNLSPQNKLEYCRSGNIREVLVRKKDKFANSRISH